jgi:hypothetical protein
MPETDYKGIQFSITFTPLPTPIKPGMKRARANGKKKTVNAIFYMHEKSHLYDMLRFALQSVDKDDDIEFHITPEGKLESDTFSVQYSIPRGPKDIQLQSEAAYQELIAQAIKRPGFRAEVKLAIEEHKVRC